MFNKEILEYCRMHSSAQFEEIKAIERASHLHTLAPQMMTDDIQGRFLRLLVQLVQPKCILEVGTYTGYATANMAWSMDASAVLHTIEVNEELAYLIRKNLSPLKKDHQINIHLGKAEEIFPKLNIKPDFVFLDAGKKDYIDHYEMILPTVPQGGKIIVDNVLWHGKVSAVSDGDSQVMDEFNRYIKNDDRVTSFLLPLRDGLYIITKK